MNLIESTHWRLWSDPEHGVQWLAAQVRHRGSWHHVIPDCRNVHSKNSPDNGLTVAAGQSADAPLPAASFHMIPYSNRIRDARFSHAGKTIQLDNAGQHAIHGALRKLPWQVIGSDADSLVCEFDSTSHGVINWPWPLKAQIEQKIVGDILTSTISICNLGDSDMPVGTGWHPYFIRHIGEDNPTLTLPVEAVFPDDSGDCLPDGAAVALPTELDFRISRELDPEQRIDCCLAGLKGACRIHWQDAGIELIMQASEACRFLVLFNPDMPHFAIEPVTNANDAFNLSARNIDAGTATLAPGEVFKVSMHLQVKLHD